MCGIMGYIGADNAVPVILDGLNKLEYRGYDSAGIAIFQDGEIEEYKKKGRLAELTRSMGELPVSDLGIGHTRWATHGVPSDNNAHPHNDCSGNIAVVHNGIIENYAALRKELMEEGHDFVSDTDTEVIAHLIEKNYSGSLEDAVRKALAYLKGSFAIAVIARMNLTKLLPLKKTAPDHRPG
jgi:glucosamine--fructose-6-phosphate aminotransferase (isomerizing)